MKTNLAGNLIRDAVRGESETGMSAASLRFVSEDRATEPLCVAPRLYPRVEVHLAGLRGV